jgi:hypothetical protein
LIALLEMKKEEDTEAKRKIFSPAPAGPCDFW